MRILVVGAGSTGGYFGGRLALAGRDVTFLVRAARAERLRADGLQLVSPHGDATVRPQVVTADAPGGPYDAMLLTVKAFGLAAALDDIAGAVGPETMIVPFLNGMRHVEATADRFGAAALGGVCRVATTLDDSGRVVQLAPFQEIAYGERAGGTSPRVEALHAAMRDAGFEARLSTNIIREMWEKWVFLAALGAVTCLMRGSVGDVVRVPCGEETAQAILSECLAVSAAEGYAMPDGFIRNVQAQLTDPHSKLTSSMYRDLMGGRPVETDQILGDLISRGRARGIAAPLLAAAHAQLSVHQARLSGAR